MAEPARRLSDTERAAFDRQGFLVLRGLCPLDEVAALRALVEQYLDPLLGPAEFEAEVGYPGAPVSRDDPGGETPRRLLQAYVRHEHVRHWATGPAQAGPLTDLFGGRQVVLSQCHHNCIMTKFPGYSSATLWHQDIRYWNFDRPELISTWLALGEETEANGALRIVPGSHVLDLDRGRLDRDLFLRPELSDNAELIDSALPVELSAGDVLLFHCRAFHAAGRNQTTEPKFSLVFTYHSEDNQPIPDTRSALYPGIPLPRPWPGDGAAGDLR